MEIFLPWNWTSQVITWSLCFVLVILVAGYLTIVSTHIVMPRRREEALKRARADANSRHEYYLSLFSNGRSRDARVRSKYFTARNDVIALQNPSALAFQWYQLRQVNWLYGVRHWLIWGLAIAPAYIVGLAHAWQQQL